MSLAKLCPNIIHREKASYRQILFLHTACVKMRGIWLKKIKYRRADVLESGKNYP